MSWREVLARGVGVRDGVRFGVLSASKRVGFGAGGLCDRVVVGQAAVFQAAVVRVTVCPRASSWLMRLRVRRCLSIRLS